MKVAGPERRCAVVARRVCKPLIPNMPCPVYVHTAFSVLTSKIKVCTSNPLALLATM